MQALAEVNWSSPTGTTCKINKAMFSALNQVASLFSRTIQLGLKMAPQLARLIIA